MAQHTGRQYDDDLTIGADEYNESFSTEYVDLFEPLGDEDAPIAKLKTIVLSIDWEITDDILYQLNEELQDLKDVWAGNKINLIYIQALEKIGRYIFTEKANAHPNAIKLLLTFYYDLEKIVSSETMSEEEKKQLLLQDVKKFDQFKLQIIPAAGRDSGQPAALAAGGASVHSSSTAAPGVFPPSQGSVLKNLKAVVLGIDWEISDKELIRLGEEVNQLEKTFADSRAKLIFLQGIRALGNYIRVSKSNAHLDAFKLLHSFYDGLERASREGVTTEQEKQILLAEVKKFNAFKAVISTIASEVVVPSDEGAPASYEMEESEDEEDEEGSGVITPAFSDMPDTVRGFRADAEVVKGDIDKGVASFLGDDGGEAEPPGFPGENFSDMEPGAGDVSSRLEALFGEDDETDTAEALDAALAGVDVETEADDDSDEKALPSLGGLLSPALAEANGQSLFSDKLPEVPVPSVAVTAPLAEIPGVDVETEADDDSDEADLPRQQGAVAPALVFSGEEVGFREAELAGELDEEEFDLEDRLDSFFGAEIEEASLGSVAANGGVSEESAAQSASEEELFAVEPEEVVEDLTSIAVAAPATEVGQDLSEEESPAGIPGLDVEDELAGELDFLEEPAPALEVQPEMMEPAPPGELLFEGLGQEMSAEGGDKVAYVIFEPVADDVEVDELPAQASSTGDSLYVSDQESLATLREYVASIVAKEYDTVFPFFFAEINRLRQRWASRYVKNVLLQLLEAVGHFIDTSRNQVDAEAMVLLQSLADKLEKVCGKTTVFDEELGQVLVEETGKVLAWQQGLIVALSSKQSKNEEAAEVEEDLTDLFTEE